MTGSSRWHVQGASDLDAAAVRVGGACMAAGAAAGSVVGWLYGRDQAQASSDVPWYAAVGLVVGVVLGLLVAIGSIFVLVAINGRAWASARLLRAALAAAGAAVPVLLLLEVMSGFAVGPEVVGFCLAVAGLPAGLATLWLDRRAGRAGRSRSDAVPRPTTSSA